MDSKPCYLARLNRPIGGLVGPQAETYLALLQQKGRALRTLYEYHRDLTALAAAYPTLPAEEFTTCELEMFLLQYLAGKAPNTQRKVYAVLSGFFGYLHTRGLTRINPAAPLDRPSRPEPDPTFWTPEDIARLLAVPLPLNEHLCLSVLAFTGQRSGVIRRLQWKHVLLEDSVIQFPRGKFGKLHTLPMHPRLEAEFKVIARRPHDPDAFVFLSRQSTPYSQQTVQRIVTKACRKAGVRPGTPHEFRRSCITNLLRTGVEFTVVSKGVAGHANPATTLRHYRGITADEVGQAVARLPY